MLLVNGSKKTVSPGVSIGPQEQRYSLTGANGANDQGSLQGRKHGFHRHFRREASRLKLADTVRHGASPELHLERTCGRMRTLRPVHPYTHARKGKPMNPSACVRRVKRKSRLSERTAVSLTANQGD